MHIRQTLSRYGIDPFLIGLITAVSIAVVLPARGEGAKVASYAVSGAVGLLFFLYGVKLSTSEVLKGLLHWRLQGLVFASTFILFPLLGLGLTTVLKPWLPPELSLGMMFLCVLPSTIQSSIAFTSIGRGNVPAAICSASMSNLFGMVATPLLVLLLLSTQGGGGFSLKALEDIAIQLLLPFIVGQLLRPRLAAFVARWKPVISMVDRGSILIVVYAAFSDGMVNGVWSQLSLANLGVVVALDMVMLAVVLVITTYGSRLLGFSKEDEITIVFCGSKKTLASGIPMANILFPGQALGLIVLPLMLFHQIQLFACAMLAQRYARRPRPAEPVSARADKDAVAA